MDEALEPVAGGGLLDRRLFLKRGLVFSATVAVSPQILAKSLDSPLPPWMLKPGEPFSNYGKPSAYEKKPYAGRWVTAWLQAMVFHGRLFTILKG